jgi:hypothetical protein
MDKISYLREAVDNHKNRIMLLCSTWKPKHKIHTYILLRASENRQQGVKINILFFILSYSYWQYIFFFVFFYFLPQTLKICIFS